MAGQTGYPVPSQYVGFHRAHSRWTTQLRDRGAPTLTLLRRFVLTFAVAMAAPAVVPVAFGWSTSVIVSGSMSPRFNVGDVVTAAPVTAGATATISAGTVLLVDNPAHPGQLLMHRLVRHEPDGSLITKGDANGVEDSTPVPLHSVKGIVRIRIPMIGLPQIWLKRHDYLPVATLAVMLGIVLLWRPRGSANAIRVT